MKKWILATFCVTMMGSHGAFAHHTPDGSGHDVAVKVHGLVCDFCAQSIDKLMRREAAVRDVHVDLGQGLITVDFNTGESLDDARVSKIVTDSGYTVVDIQRDM